MHKDQVAPLQEQNVTASAPSQCSQTQTTSTSNTHMGLFCHSSRTLLFSCARATSYIWIGKISYMSTF